MTKHPNATSWDENPKWSLISSHFCPAVCHITRIFSIIYLLLLQSSVQCVSNLLKFSRYTFPNNWTEKHQPSAIPSPKEPLNEWHSHGMSPSISWHRSESIFCSLGGKIVWRLVSVTQDVARQLYECNWIIKSAINCCECCQNHKIIFWYKDNLHICHGQITKNHCLLVIYFSHCTTFTWLWMLASSCNEDSSMTPWDFGHISQSNHKIDALGHQDLLAVHWNSSGAFLFLHLWFNRNH